MAPRAQDCAFQTVGDMFSCCAHVLLFSKLEAECATICPQNIVCGYGCTKRAQNCQTSWTRGGKSLLGVTGVGVVVVVWRCTYCTSSPRHEATERLN